MRPTFSIVFLFSGQRFVGDTSFVDSAKGGIARGK